MVRWWSEKISSGFEAREFLKKWFSKTFRKGWPNILILAEREGVHLQFPPCRQQTPRLHTSTSFHLPFFGAHLITRPCLQLRESTTNDRKSLRRPPQDSSSCYHFRLFCCFLFSTFSFSPRFCSIFFQFSLPSTVFLSFVSIIVLTSILFRFCFDFCFIVFSLTRIILMIYHLESLPKKRSWEYH